MNIASYSEFFHSQGMKILKTSATAYFWREVRPRFFLRVPENVTSLVSYSEIKELLSRGALGLRYSTAEEMSSCTSWYMACVDKNYKLGSLHRIARQNTRRGLENCVLRQIDFAELKECGVEINQDALSRQGRIGMSLYSSPQRWSRYMDLCQRTPDVEAFGALCGNSLVAYIIFAVVDDCAFMIHRMSRSATLKLNVDKALFYWSTQQMIQRSTINTVFAGLASISPMPQLDHFKEAMGFSRIPVTQHFSLHPWIRQFIRPRTLRFMRGVQGLFRTDLVEKAIQFSEWVMVNER